MMLTRARRDRRVLFLTGEAFAGTSDLNAAATDHWINSSQVYQTKADLRGCTEVRLLANRKNNAAAAGYQLRLMYSTAYTADTTPTGYLDIGVSDVVCDCETTNTFVDSGWIRIAAGARADVFVAPVASGGDGAADPNFGNIAAEFR